MLQLEDADAQEGQPEPAFAAGGGVAGEGVGENVAGLKEGGDVGPCLGDEEVVYIEEFGDAGEGRVPEVGGGGVFCRCC